MPTAGAVTSNLSLSTDGSLVAAGMSDGGATVWGARGGQLLRTVSGHRGPVDGVALSRGGALLVTASDDGTAHIWGLPDGAVIATLTAEAGPTHAVDISPDGLLIATGPEDGMLRLWRIQSTRPDAAPPTQAQVPSPPPYP